MDLRSIVLLLHRETSRNSSGKKESQPEDSQEATKLHFLPFS
jgi:hypothetical protein